MSKITYKHGDLFAGVQEALAAGKRVLIPHVCNDVGGWGSGFVVPLGRNYPFAKDAYLQWHKDKFAADWRTPLLSPNVSFELGETQIVVMGKVAVANMIGQHQLIRPDYVPVRYTAIANCLETVKSYCQSMSAEVHAPRFGAGLAGGNWVVIEALINEILVNNGIPVTVYELTVEEQKERVVQTILKKPEIIDELIERFDMPIVD